MIMMMTKIIMAIVITIIMIKLTMMMIVIVIIMIILIIIIVVITVMTMLFAIMIKKISTITAIIKRKTYMTDMCVRYVFCHFLLSIISLDQTSPFT